MIKPLIFATIAAIGNAIFVFGQKGAQVSKNPFLFMFGAVLICTILFFFSTLSFPTEKNISYLISNWKFILLSGVGFFVTFLGFYLLYSGYGASTYIIYAVVSIITTSIGVGVLYYKEPFNFYHFLALIFSIITITCFCYGQHIAKPEKQFKGDLNTAVDVKQVVA
ncbi:hypothetical protein [Desulfocicer niacini]